MTFFLWSYENEALQPSITPKWLIHVADQCALNTQVMKLKGKLKEQSGGNFRTQTYVEETVESTSEGLRCSNKPTSSSIQQAVPDQGYNNNNNSTTFIVEDFNNSVSMPPNQCHWPVLPNYYP